MDLKILTMQGKTYYLSDYNTTVRDFIVSSIPIESEITNLEGADKKIDYGAVTGQRPITVPITLKADDLLDYPLLRDTIFQLAVNKEPFYISELRRPKKLAYEFVDTNEPARMDSSTDNVEVAGKRYLVRISDSFQIDQVELFGDTELNFITTGLPYAESIITSGYIDKNGMQYDDNLTIGLGFSNHEAEYIYRNTFRKFRIFNAGTAEVHPFEQNLRIEISGVKDKNFTIWNKTTGDLFEVKKPLAKTDKVELNGANIYINSANALRDTNLHFITLAAGWNEFEMSSNGDTYFDFRYYYM